MGPRRWKAEAATRKMTAQTKKAEGATRKMTTGGLDGQYIRDVVFAVLINTQYENPPDFGGSTKAIK